MKKHIILIAVVGIVVLALSYNFLAQNNAKNAPKTLKIGVSLLNIEIAKTDLDRERGLSGRVELAENEGLLFIFDREGYYGFWMKDMNFPIDIAWLDKNKKIIHIEENILPETYPKIFNATSTSLYVLETRAEFFKNSKIKIGDFAEF